MSRVTLTDSEHNAHSAGIPMTLNPEHYSMRLLPPVASNSMNANGTDCASQNTLAGPTRLKSRMVKEVLLSLFFLDT